MLQLPEATPALTQARLAGRSRGRPSSTPPVVIESAIASVQALLGGEPRDLADIELDYEGVPDFHRRVYVAARRIRPGEVVTYGELARRLLAPGAARAVGQALGRNPFAIIVPCHRVLASGGKIGGFSANGGTCTKLSLLTLEGARELVRVGSADSRQRSLFPPSGVAR